MAQVAPFSQIEPYIIQPESGGQNIFQNLVSASKSTAQGYFQITNTTWAGVPTTITQGYTNAMSAPFSVQQAAANWLWTTNNGSDWLGNGTTYPGDSAIIAANAALVAGQIPSMKISPTVTALISSNAGASGSGTVSSATAAAGDNSVNWSWLGVPGTIATGGATAPVSGSAGQIAASALGAGYNFAGGIGGLAASMATAGAATPAVSGTATSSSNPATSGSSGVVSTILTFLGGGALNIVVAAIALMLLAFAVWPSTKYILEKPVRV
jgi:hypothetical protein